MRRPGRPEALPHQHAAHGALAGACEPLQLGQQEPGSTQSWQDQPQPGGPRPAQPRLRARRRERLYGSGPGQPLEVPQFSLGALVVARGDVDTGVKERGTGAPPGAGAATPEPGNPRELTAAIVACGSPGELRALCGSLSHRLNFIHAAAAITRLAKMGSASEGRGRGGGGPEAGPAGRGGAGQAGPGPGSERLQRESRHWAPAIAGRPGTAPTPGPAGAGGGRGRGGGDELAACAEGLAGLVASHAAEFPPRALANSLWAAAKLARRLHPDAEAEAAALDGSPDAQAEAEAEEASSSSSSSSGSSGRGSTEGPAGRALRALVTLSLRLLGAAAEVPAHEFEPQHLSNVVYAAALVHEAMPAALPLGPPPGLQDAASAAHRGTGPALPPSQRAVRACASALLAASRGRLHELGPQALSNVLYAAGLMGLRPEPAWLAAVLAAAAPQLARFEPQHASNTLWALARMEFYPGGGGWAAGDPAGDAGVGKQPGGRRAAAPCTYLCPSTCAPAPTSLLV